MAADDFGILGGTGIQQSGKEAKEAKDHGQKRLWNKVFETLAPQMLNAYGPAKYAKMSDAEVWKHFNEPLKSGAKYMTEFCNKDAERRGIRLNRPNPPLAPLPFLRRIPIFVLAAKRRRLGAARRRLARRGILL